jgi:protein adenylyltransferase
MTNCGFNFDTTYTSLPEHFFTKINPDPIASPDVVIINNALAESMHLDFSRLNDNEQAALFSGNQLPEGLTPFAQAYAGHQYGHFTLLGDGRALVWGEHVIPDGTRFDIQFKGSGATPYSRRGDGKAVLGPMLREYIISEAMHHLGIPTTRSLAVTSTGEPVLRERALPGAILTRVASSHIRVGTFEYAAATRDRNAITSILDYTIQRHYPDLIDNSNKALALIQAVMEKQVDLIVDWMRVGFIHGVMNTDNMTLSGETIDYGPCAFMDNYDPNTVFSSIDHMGRYAYANQPKIAQWNLARLAETLLPLINDDFNAAIEVAEDTIKQFPDIYQRKWLAMMGAKLGLVESLPNDETLISDLLDWMRANNADYTNTFRDLSQAEKPKGQSYQDQAFAAWNARWQNRLNQTAQTTQSSLCLMKNSNPVVIPRNHKVEEALQAAHDQDFKPLRALLDALTTPYQDDAKLHAYQLPPEPNERVLQTFCGT